MEASRVILMLGVLSCLLLATNLVLVVVLWSRASTPSNNLEVTEDDTTYPLVNVQDFKVHAKRVMDKNAWLYMKQGATTEQTTRENEAAFSMYRLRPHMLRGVAGANTTTTILGHVVSCPIGISPTAYHRLVTPEGENATARAARSRNIVATFSATSTVRMEDIAAAAPGGVYWQHIYLFGLPEVTLDFVRRAERAGFSGLVLTIDRPVRGIRYHVLKGQIKFPYHVKKANYYNDTEAFKAHLVNPGQTWDQLSWLRKQTKLPIIVKGILRGEDAKMAIEAGAEAVLVSNHGGRVLDGVPATIDVLSEVVAAVNGSVEVYMDGGIRTGMDVAKAIALGARAVFIGRPVWYGLAHSGQEGLEKVLDILQTEFLNAMQLLGADRPHKLDSSVILTPPSCVGKSCEAS